MGFLDKLLGGGGPSIEDEYFDALVELGELVVQRPPRSVRLRRLPGVEQTQQVLEKRQKELQRIEQKMEHSTSKSDREAEEESAELPDLEATIHENRAGIANVERKVSALSKELKAKKANFKYFVLQVEAQQKKVDDLDEAGKFEKADGERRQLKHVKLEHMRQESGLRDLEEDIEMTLSAEGRFGDGVRAKMRREEIQENTESRDKDLRTLMEEIDRDAVDKEGQIADADDAYAEALAAVGEEVYGQRIEDPRFTALYAALDPLAQQLTG